MLDLLDLSSMKNKMLEEYRLKVKNFGVSIVLMCLVMREK